MKKELTDEQVLAKYEKLSNKKKVDVLYEAIQFMRQYNGRTYDECIVLAMENIIL